MKIKKINIYNSDVSIADKVINSGFNDSWGLTKLQYDQLSSFLKSEEHNLSKIIRSDFNSEDIKNLSDEKRTKFVDILKSFGVDVASHLTAIGVIDLLKFFLNGS